MLLLLFAAIVSCLAFRVVVKRTSHPPFPPGPSGYPLIGNLSDKWGIFNWRRFSEHRALWGDLTSVTLFGNPIVTIHTYEKAVELLDKKGLICSSRPAMQMLSLGGWSDHVVLMPYGTPLRECRRMMRTEINHVKVGQFQAHQEASVKRFVRLLLKKPDDFYHLTEWYAGSIILKIVYGYDTLEENDPMIAVVQEGIACLEEATKPGYLIDVFPWLRYIPAWFPFAGFKRSALVWRERYANMREMPFDFTVDNMKGDDQNVNFVAKWLNKINSAEQLWRLKHTATMFFSAGVDTTSLVLHTFFFRMQQHPSIQERAQRELDDVLGRGRFPTFADRPNLPYIVALCKELLRDNPPVPGGVPHKSTADYIYDGYFIPNGTVLIPSIWEMSHDPEVYPDPDTFDPNRFTGDQPERDPALYVFGFGRRICSGILLAEDTLYLTIATILATFDIIPFDPKAPAKLEFTEGVLSHPLPFECNITPRARITISDELIQ